MTTLRNGLVDFASLAWFWIRLPYDVPDSWFRDHVFTALPPRTRASAMAHIIFHGHTWTWDPRDESIWCYECERRWAP